MYIPLIIVILIVLAIINRKLALIGLFLAIAWLLLAYVMFPLGVLLIGFIAQDFASTGPIARVFGLFVLGAIVLALVGIGSYAKKAFKA